MNLFLAFLWFAGGVALLVYQWTTGEAVLYVRGTHVSFGWLLLALCLYNLMRWWQLRAYQADREAQRILEARRSEHERHREEPRERDPNFIFTDEPPPAPNPNITNEPPPNH